MAVINMSKNQKISMVKEDGTGIYWSQLGSESLCW